MSETRTGGLLEWHNAGPLTATWSAPAACATSGGHIRRGPANPGFNNSVAYLAGSCNNGLEVSDECRPGGEKVNEIYADEDRNVQPTLSHFYSATECPQGWETAGVAAMNNGTPTVTGIFAPTVFYDGSPSETIDFPYGNWLANMFTTILEPTETAVACCPSGFTADMYAGCYSNFPLTELAGSTACQVRYQPTGNYVDNMYTETWAYEGSTTTQTVRGMPFTSGWRDSDEASTRTIPFGSDGLPEPTNTSDIFGDGSYFKTAVAQAEVIFLVNDAGSEESAAPSGTGSEAPAAPSETGTEESAAHALSANGWGMVGGIMAAWGISMVAGVGLLAAW